MTFEQITHGFRITVRPSFLLSQSRPEAGRFVFLYEIEIQNVGEETGTLLRRHWRIHDGIGEDTKVDGDGVIGQQPRLERGELHRYQSFCVLKGPTGFMEGHYVFVRPDGEEFQVCVPRFELRAIWIDPGVGPEMH